MQRRAEKKLYSCPSTVSALDYCSRIFFLQILQLSVRSGAHKLFRRFFWIFAIFDCKLAKIVAPSSDKNENCVVHLKELSLLKKPENLVEMGQ